MYSHAGIHIMQMGRKNADPLVGLPHISRSYDAAQSAHVDQDALRFKKRRWQNAHCMFVKGFILETIGNTTDSSQSGSIPEEWLKLGNWKILKDFEKDEGPPEEFWRTIVADRGKDGRNPPYYYSRAYKESVYKGGLASGSVNTSDLINNERNSIVAQFCRRAQAVIWNRSIVKTNQGNLGVASKTVKKGDLVCILYGCSVPVILRRKEKSPKTIKLEKQEDAMFEKVEIILRRYMSSAKAIKNRKEKWKNLPEKKTGAFKWGKEDVRKWLEEYKQLVTKAALRKNRDDILPMPARSNYQREPKLRDDCYYEFIGECYIHGMMDGEAIRRKTKYEDKLTSQWANERKEAIPRKLQEYEEKRKKDRADEGKQNDALDPKKPGPYLEAGSGVVVTMETGKHVAGDEPETKEVPTVELGTRVVDEPVDIKPVGDEVEGIGPHGLADGEPAVDELGKETALRNDTGLLNLADGEAVGQLVTQILVGDGEQRGERSSVEDSSHGGLQTVIQALRERYREETVELEKAEEEAWDEWRKELLRDTIFELR